MSKEKPLILHIENDLDDVFLTQRAFKRAGHTNPIAVAENGEKGVAYLLAQEPFASRNEYPLPAVILLDWNMPLMSGAEFLHWLQQQQSSLKRIPVIVLTSSNNEEDMHEAYELGANGFLVKPRTNDAFQAMAFAFTSYWLQWNRSDTLATSNPL